MMSLVAKMHSNFLTLRNKMLMFLIFQGYFAIRTKIKNKKLIDAQIRPTKSIIDTKKYYNLQ